MKGRFYLSHALRVSKTPKMGGSISDLFQEHVALRRIDGFFMGKETKKG